MKIYKKKKLYFLQVYIGDETQRFSSMNVIILIMIAPNP